jgi:threonine aldolase
MAAHSKGLHVHLDGARLFNAATSLQCDVGAIAQLVDSGTFCLSKGLGCPIGSVVFGSTGFAKRVRRLRKLVGGGTRQAGVVAAAGLYALDHNVARLAEDHANARDLAARLQHVVGIELVNSDVQSNIVYVRLDGRSGRRRRLVSSSGSAAVDGGNHEATNQELQMLVAGLKEAGLRVSGGYGIGGLRFVTHRDVSAGHVAHLANSIDRLLNPPLL